MEPLARAPKVEPGALLYATRSDPALVGPDKWNCWLAKLRHTIHGPRMVVAGGLIVNVPENKLAQMGPPTELWMS